MKPSMPAGEVVADLGARVSAGWFATLVTALLLIVVGKFAAHLAGHLASRSIPELYVLLDESAAFYSRWPQDRLGSAPRSELMAEAARCRRTIGLLESSGEPAISGQPASRGPVDGLRAWVALLHQQIEQHVTTPPGLSHA